MLQIKAAVVGGDSLIGNDDELRVVFDVVCVVRLMRLGHRIFHSFHCVVEGVAEENFYLIL